MFEVSFVKDEQIAECSGDEVEQSSTGIGNDVQAQQLPKHVFFWPTGRINVRREEIVISIIQHYIHVMHTVVAPSAAAHIYCAKLLVSPLLKNTLG